MQNLVPVLAANGKAGEAAALAQRIARLNPAPPYHYFDQGMAAYRAGDFAKARALFAREVARAPYNDEFHFWLGVANFQLGEIETAEKQLALARDNSVRSDTRERYSAKLAHLRDVAAAPRQQREVGMVRRPRAWRAAAWPSGRAAAMKPRRRCEPCTSRPAVRQLNGLTAALEAACAWCRSAARFDVTEHDTALVQVVRRQFKRDFVASQDTDVVFLHPARGVGDQLVAVVEVDAETQFRQHFGDEAIHFDEFFFCHF